MVAKLVPSIHAGETMRGPKTMFARQDPPGPKPHVVTRAFGRHARLPMGLGAQDFVPDPGSDPTTLRVVPLSLPTANGRTERRESPLLMDVPAALDKRLEAPRREIHRRLADVITTDLTSMSRMELEAEIATITSELAR
jgi:hypothetical protein